MYEIKILTEVCKACGYCVDACPKGVLGFGKSINQMGYQIMEVKRQELCVGCTSCATVCPDAAIEIYKEDE